ncbi:MAG: DUF2341 domain-containing protein [Ferruginibacter sp.]
MKLSTSHKFLISVTVSFFTLSFLPTSVQGQAWYNTSWLYRKAITVDFTKVGTGPHTNFPLLINIVDADLKTGALSNYNDILFTSSDGTTRLDHEVESYTSSSGALVAWIQIPSLSSSANTIIYMYYGNASASAQQNITGTWDATYQGVYHLNNAFLDATANNYDGTNGGTNNVTGKISNGRKFARSGGADYITIPGLMGTPANATLSAWGNLNSRDAVGAHIINIGDYLSLCEDDITNGALGAFYNGGWGLTASNTNYAGAWHYFTYTFDDAANLQKFYVDGVLMQTSTSAASIVYTGQGTNTFIGKHANGNANYDYDGNIDEVRVSGTARSVGWILTEYNNQDAPSTFFSVGNKEQLKIFTGTGNFSATARWTGSSLPLAGDYLIIDGNCTVDNYAATNNIAYGPLVIGRTAAYTLSWATSGTNRLNVTNVSSSFAASSLNMGNGGTLIIRGTWTATNLTFTPGTGTIETQSTITLPAAYTTYNNLIVNGAGTIVSTAIGTTINNNLTVTSGSFDIGTYTLKIAGGISNSGTFTASNGTIELNGSSPQTIPANTFAGNSLLNLIINNNVTLAGTAVITGTLTVGTSGKTFATGDYLTLKSTVLGTAKIAALPVNGAGAATSFITGIVTVERYIPQNRSWRLITSPLSNTGLIYNSWQNAGVYQAGKGMLVTGPTPTVANGLDTSSKNSVSMKTFSTATQAYINITNTKSSNLSNSTGSADNIGYFAFIRGDRNPINLYAPNTNTTTLSSAGTIQTGKQIFTASPALNAYTLMGNPYASPVDFNNMQRAHIRKRFYAWDATISLGVYLVLDDLDGNGVFSTSNSSSLQDKNIQSGQAFFVETDTTGAASLTYYESSKSTVNTNAGFRPLDNTKSLAMTLNFLQADNSVSKADAALAEFDGSFNSGVDFQDAIKFINTGETFSLQRNGTALAIERRPLINMNDTLFLKLIQASQRNYQFVFNASNLYQPGLLAFLEDMYTGTTTPVNLQGSTSVDFTIDAAAASIQSDRFRIVFKTATVLPVDFSDVKAWQQGDDIAVRWSVENQLNVQRYEVEKSTDGSNFIKVNSQPATSTNNFFTYNWLDTHAVAGDNLYRIRNVDVNGTATYSKVAKVSMGKSTGSMNVYPNPVTDGRINLQLIGIAKGNYRLRLTNQIGQELLTKKIAHAGGSVTNKILLPKDIATGIYHLEIINPDQSKKILRIIIP